MQNPRRHRHEGCRRDRRAWPRHRRNQRAWLRHPWAAGPGRTTSQHADRSSRRGRPKWAGLTPPPAKFRMQFPRSTNRDKLNNRRISTIRTQTPTCAHGNCMRNCWLAAMAGHQGNVPSDISREGPTGAEGAGGNRKAWSPPTWHTPGATAGHGAQKTRGSTSNNQRHTATRSVL